MKLKLSCRDRIVFFGDSITAHGFWEAEVIEYFLRHEKALQIRFFNCGISGSRGDEANLKDRMYMDCLNYFPRYVVVMFGMNDIRMWLYANTDAGSVAERERRLAAYEGSLEAIIDRCLQNDATPIICSPTPYDEYSDAAGYNYKVDGALKHCRDVAEKVAKKHGLIFVDMREILMAHLDEKPVSDDRVHPSRYGHHLMAEQFLYTIGAKKGIEPDAVCELSPRNEARFETEDILRDLFFVEQDFLGWQNGKAPAMPRRKALLRKQVKADGRNFDTVVRNYTKYADYKDELLAKLLRQTLELYDD